MMTAADNLAGITSALALGHTVHIVTETRSTVITPATARKWAAKGLTLFKATPSGLWMASGRKFVCIDYCKIVIQESRTVRC